ncbi:chorismate-binding protein [Criblamydia sequanensis]|uniref:Menaquinone-specific isochorismate synthase n=1 Tax=Candidatus Criblamydia sequanensis CRIB-18 TaxID=1437425 RepID=A0A090DY59_9BACT|nr:chorismate-binding protein [Criblamydia sequanensis]CDR33684.1 Putative menaquinone-specific isochorismate synthase [Criblamydia sequanensis CRIB-18]
MAPIRNKPYPAFDMIEAFLNNGSLLQFDKKRLLIGWGEKIFRDNPSYSSEKPTFYFPDFFLEDETKATFNHEFNSLIEVDELTESLNVGSESYDYKWETEGELLFKETVDKHNECFQTNRLKKVVPYVFEAAKWQLKKERIGQWIRSLIKESKPFPLSLYGTWDEHFGLLGATPEILFNLDEDKKELKTIALAGTLESTINEKVLIDQKTFQEHQFVIEGIREDLSPFGKVEIGEREQADFGNLLHFFTPIILKWNTFPSFFEMIRALHPTPALGAYPKFEGFQWLKKYNEALPRYRFGAPAGFSFPAMNKYCCYVAIRGMQWDDKEVRIGAGCGIVKGSKRDEEWKEIKLKMSMIKKLFQIPIKP